MKTQPTYVMHECEYEIGTYWTENLNIYFASLLAVGKYVQGWVIFSCSKGAS